MRQIYNFFFSVVLLVASGQLSAQDFSVTNTGSNMTVFMTQGCASEANVANIGIFFTNDAGELQCAGSFSEQGDEPLPVRFFFYLSREKRASSRTRHNRFFHQRVY